MYWSSIGEFSAVCRKQRPFGDVKEACVNND